MSVLFKRVAYAASAMMGLTVGFAVASANIDSFLPSAPPASPTLQATAASFAAQPDVHPIDAPWIAHQSGEWAAFQNHYIAADGRVIDTGNGNESHSEGQGFGMLFAVTFNDRASFDRIFAWTEQNLKHTDDSLHAWRYIPNSPMHVPDINNATDGDIFIAAALARAAQRWHVARYAEAADAIDRDILSQLVMQVGGRTILLPGAQGFERRDTVVVNPSYYPFAILHDLAALTPSPAWAAIQHDGAAMIGEARFGAWGLPPDWLQVSRADGSLTIAPGWPARFSFDAIRIPLYMAWSGDLDPALRHRFTALWTAQPEPAAWVDLQTGAQAPYGMTTGIAAIARLAATPPEQTDIALPHVGQAHDYYSAALTLLSRIAAHERPAAQPGPPVLEATMLTGTVPN